MGFWDPWKGGWEPLGQKPCPEGSTGSNRVYTRNRWRAKKLIPDKLNGALDLKEELMTRILFPAREENL